MNFRDVELDGDGGADHASFEVNDTLNFRRTFKFMSRVLSTAQVVVDEHGVYVRAADSSMVGLVRVDIDGEALGDVSVEGDGQLNAGLDLERFMNVLDLANKSDDVSVEVDLTGELATWTLHVDRGSHTVTRWIPVLNLNNEELQSINKLEYPIEFDVPFLGFRQALSVMRDSLTFDVDDDAFLMYCESNDVETRVEFDDAIDTQREVENDDGDLVGRAPAMFSRGYVKHVKQLKSLADTMHVRLREKYPVSMQFESGDGICIDYIVAPRIEEGD